MKSLSSAESDEPEERLLTEVEPNDSHVLGAKTPGTSERLIEASPKSPTPIVPPEIASVNEAVLTIASAKPAAERSCGALHALPVHVERLITGVPLPPKSYEMRRSPAVRL